MQADGLSCRRERFTALRQEAPARWSSSIEVLILSRLRGSGSGRRRGRGRRGNCGARILHHRPPIVTAAAFHSPEEFVGSIPISSTKVNEPPQQWLSRSRGAHHFSPLDASF